MYHQFKLINLIEIWVQENNHNPNLEDLGNGNLINLMNNAKEEIKIKIAQSKSV
jgi:hypothetical protein